MAIRPTCSVTPTAFKNAGKVLRINAKSKVILSPYRRMGNAASAVHSDVGNAG